MFVTTPGAGGCGLVVWGACDRDVTDGERRPVGPNTDKGMEALNDERAVRQIERRRTGPVDVLAIWRAAAEQLLRGAVR